MQTHHSAVNLRSALAPWRGSGQKIAFVPTMGNLHEGHLSLVDQARNWGDCVVVSIFVNPLQFGAGEDFDSYPRTVEEDSLKLAEAGVSLLFAPPVAEIYPRELAAMTHVEVPGFSDILCGAHRPGHFRGVATIVNKLFNIVQPDVALFGEKDFQQLLVIRRMVDDLAMPIDVVGLPTIREPDGLAMSSRNLYLDPDDRVRAPGLYQTLLGVAERLKGGEADFPLIENDALKSLSNKGFKPEYVSIRRACDLSPPTAADAELVVLAAARLGATRLIDNLRCSGPELPGGRPAKA